MIILGFSADMSLADFLQFLIYMILGVIAFLCLLLIFINAMRDRFESDTMARSRVRLLIGTIISNSLILGILMVIRYMTS
jgi:magnesium-transporting ATPase (P-type)